jgi:hypothetical protein
MIIIKTNNDITIENLKSFIVNETPKNHYFYTLIYKDKNKTKISFYKNNLNFKDLLNLLTVNTNDQKTIDYSFIIITKPHLNDVRALGISKNNNFEEDETYNSIICFDGMFNNYKKESFVNFCQNKTLIELSTFINVKNLRLSIKDEIDYWDFLIDDDDDNLAMASFDNDEDIKLMSDNFIKHDKYSLSYSKFK